MSVVPGGTRSLVDGGNKYEGHSQPQVHLPFAVRLHTSDATSSEPMELFLNTFLWSVHDAQARAQEPELSRLVNIHAMNAHLQSAAGRMAFGDKTDVLDLLKLVKPLGFQITNTDADVMRKRTEAVITVAVSHKVRTPNVWLALGREMNVGDRLYWLLRRVPFTAFDLGIPGADNVPNAFFGVAVKAGKAIPKHYWRFEPYISSDNRPPPRSLYTDKEWTGAYFLVGQVNEFYNGKDSSKFRAAAKQAMFPDLSLEYKEHLTRLPVVELYYLCA